ncbi:ABC transporter ATP-binding protein [Chlorobium ferrooxidans]|uniref:ABC transporter, transmembrane region:ABC transporter related n=1 Tax=Chlorobium ferrooxidans DSM 13031 TaxID=377431 RepID=Q0YSH8_9CHLB|nr:ABC transporter ATP-binding protein [Chlorobium ferrooxidans]EAT59221.1 ABC transporter, transmembrane region:ABC transporter related [Chlorobium ferrooxidans DSM 13031]
MKVLSRIVRYLLPSKGKIALVLVVSIMTSLLGVVSIYSVLPLLNAVFTADRTIAGSVPPETASLHGRAPEKSTDQVPVVFNGFDTEKLKASVTESFAEAFHAETKERTLLNICLFLIGAFAVKNMFVYMNGQLLYRIQTKTAKQLRDDVFNNIIEMHLDYFNKNRVGNLMNLVYNDVQTVNESVSSTFVNFLQNPFAVVVYACVLLVLSWKLTLFATVTSLLIFFVISIIGKQVKGLASAFRTKMGDMNSVLQEKFSGIKVIKSSAFENVELQRFQSFTRDFRKLDIRIARLRNIISPVNETLLVAAIALVLWFGGLQVFEGRMTSSELILFAFTLYSTMGPIKKFGDISSQMAVGKASAERLFELLDTVPDISNGSRSITGFSHEIRFEDVSFKYSKEADAPNVLDHVSFELKKGEMVALVGQSGSGKSTTVDLLLRFYDVDSGRITIDGIDIREYDFKQLRRMIGVVSQEVILFNDTIRENIAYGIHGEISQEKVIMAAKMANAHHFIEEKPEQYDTLIGDRGVQLSGGQRQRLAIARAMVKNPELLVFDEATSALDNESEKVVQEAIDHALENRTALVVAHRLSTVRNADRIIVMERGRAVESGSHEELLALGGLYRQLYDIQFSGKTQESERTPVAS